MKRYIPRPLEFAALDDLPKPYYQDDLVTIYHGDCREFLPIVPQYAVVITDPPYGIDHTPSAFWNGQKIIGDDSEFDPSHLLEFSGQVIFGANHFADKLPASPGWIVWNKRDRVSRNLPGSDAELAWVGGGLLNQVRIITHVWIPHTLRTEPAYHPTQKPVALMRQILETVGDGEELIVDPYMGAGATLCAAKELGQQVIGIEIEERYCEIAAGRLAQERLVFPVGGSAVGNKNLRWDMLDEAIAASNQDRTREVVDPAREPEA